MSVQKDFSRSRPAKSPEPTVEHDHQDAGDHHRDDDAENDEQATTPGTTSRCLSHWSHPTGWFRHERLSPRSDCEIVRPSALDVSCRRAGLTLGGAQVGAHTARIVRVQHDRTLCRQPRGVKRWTRARSRSAVRRRRHRDGRSACHVRGTVNATLTPVDFPYAIWADRMRNLPSMTHGSKLAFATGHWCGGLRRARATR